MNTLDTLFNPKAVAVIGASSKPLSIGNRVIKNLIDFGYRGKIYPINPKTDEIHGLKAYRSILEVPTGVDVVHMVIPARFVPDAVDDCGKKGVRHIIINSGGFAEVGPAGQAIENDFLARAAKYGIRILGPNCQGIINTDPDVRVYCNFTYTRPETGHISLVALSGGVAEVIHQGFVTLGVGTRIYASNGNACDIGIPELIRYLGQDEKTRVIVTYVEGLREPAEFMAACKEVATCKPVLAMKAGRTAQGAQAAASHTGGLAREDLATDLIFKKTGVLGFNDVGELVQAAAAFATQPVPHGNRLGIITNTGGPAVIATDILAEAGMELPPLSDTAKAFLKERLFPEASIHNPVDVLATGKAEHYRAALDAMMNDDNFDAVLVHFVTPFFVDCNAVASEIVAVSQQGRKPLICNFMTDRKQWSDTAQILETGGVVCFDLPDQAARAMAALVRYQSLQQRKVGHVQSFGPATRHSAASILEAVHQEGRSLLSAAEAYAVLDAYGIPTPTWRVVNCIEDAIQAAETIGYPVVIKADAPDIVHKSDLGAVALDLTDATAVRIAIEQMVARLNVGDVRYLVQKYVPGGLEVIMGAKAEPGLGHAILFGMGGVYVEVLKDVVFNLAPVTDVEAREMVAGLKLSPLLQGVRGQKGVARDKLADMIQRLSQLVCELPTIKELDLNPILAFENDIRVADVRIII